MLAWEPSYVCKFSFSFKSQLIKLGTAEPNKKHPRDPFKFPIKISGKSVKGFLSYDPKKDRQT